MRTIRAPRFGAMALVIAGGLLISANARAEDTSARKPNIVVLVSDDMGYADIGVHGNKDFATPHIDSIAANGVRCTSGYVSGMYCSPTRAGLLSGRYQQRFGHEWNPSNAADAGLPVSEKTIADRLRSAGYKTGLVGKWHLGNSPQFHPLERGFDEFFGFLGGAHAYFAEKTRNIYRNHEIVVEKEYLTDAFAREAVAFIDRHQAEPFFLEVAFNAVHTPMQANDDRLARFAAIPDETRRTYAAMLTAMDDAIGAILKKIRDAGLEDDTLIVFFNDNGGPMMRGTTVNGSRNAPYRGSKRTSLEGGIRVPFLWSWKGKLPAGKTYDQPIIQLDILPTALAVAGVEVKPEWKLDGVDLLPYLKGTEAGSPHESLYWRMGNQAAIRQGNWKLVRYDITMDTAGARSVPARIEVTPFRLYDLDADPGESKNLSTEKPLKIKEMLDAWEAWNATLALPLWGPKPVTATNE